MILAVGCGLLVLVLVRRRLVRRSVARRSAVLGAGLAPTIDLIVVVLGSGGTVHEAVAVVSEVGPLPVRHAFAEVLRCSADGLLLGDALVVLYDLLTPGFQPLIGALLSADRDGGALTPLLRSLADDAEQARAFQVQAASKQLAVSLVLPLVVCLLPAVVIGALVPLVVVAARQLGA
ncbi:MAG: type II secretion system F family protein [Actinomycetota bacterium]